MQLSKKNKAFCDLSLRFWNLSEILNILKKLMMTLVAYVFTKVRTGKYVIR